MGHLYVNINTQTVLTITDRVVFVCVVTCWYSKWKAGGNASLRDTFLKNLSRSKSYAEKVAIATKISLFRLFCTCPLEPFVWPSCFTRFEEFFVFLFPATWYCLLGCLKSDNVCTWYVRTQVGLFFVVCCVRFPSVCVIFIVFSWFAFFFISRVSLEPVLLPPTG